MDPTLQQPTADDDESQRNFDFMAEIRALIQASGRESEEESIIASMRESEERFLTTFNELIDKYELKIKLLAEAKREAERVAAIKHALQAKQQAEESRAKEQKSVERRSAFEHTREQIEKESAEWQRRKLAESEQGSYVFWQQRLRKERQAESNARACIEGDFKADSTTASADDVTKSFQDAPEELQQGSASDHITDSTPHLLW